MRRTVTLDFDTEQVIRELMKERGLSFKEALNEAIRHTTAVRRARKPFRTTTFGMGRSAINLGKALEIVGDLEDEDLLRTTRSGS
jgi:hypothetical protein